MIQTKYRVSVSGLAALCLATVVQAGVPVEVTINGTVEFNQVNPNNSPLGTIMSGDSAKMTFLVDSDNFVDNASFPTRGYEIDQSSYSFTMGDQTLGLQNPFPAGLTPWFVLRDNDPAVDGFFVSDSPNFPNGVPTDEPGAFGQFKAASLITYDGATLSSLDILDALGTYDYTGLTVFNYTVLDGPFEPIGLEFIDMTIRTVPEPGGIVLLLIGLVPCFRRRR